MVVATPPMTRLGFWGMYAVTDMLVVAVPVPVDEETAQSVADSSYRMMAHVTETE